ncbi:MAG: hypothetical protein U9N33_10420 [Campylobacterota bacterium]|nr:hypothetical protein [Campylobacterota bacterium]
MMFLKKKIIDMNEYSQRELQVMVDSYIKEYHGNRNKNKIFKELNKVDDYLLQMRNAGLSIEKIREFLIEFYNYKVGMHTISDYFKTFHPVSSETKV